MVWFPVSASDLNQKKELHINKTVEIKSARTAFPPEHNDIIFLLIKKYFTKA